MSNTLFKLLLFAYTVAASHQICAQSNQQLEEVIVTSTFISRALDDVPSAISVITTADLAQAGIANLSHVASVSPNTILVDTGGAYGPSMAAQIRGIGQFDFNPAYEPAVGIFIDGVYWPTLIGSNIPLLNIDSVEIARGPQGTLAGRNSIGGAIHINTVSPDPTEGNRGEISFATGSRHLSEASTHAQIGLSPSVAISMAISDRFREGYVQRFAYGCNDGKCQRGELGGENSTTARLRIVKRLDRLDIDLAYHLLRMNQGGPAEVLTFASESDQLCGDRCTYASYQLPAGDALLGQPGSTALATEFAPDQVLKTNGFSVTANYRLPNSATIKLISAHNDYNSSFGTDDDFSAQARGAGGFNTLDHVSLSHELRYTQIFDQWDATLGLFYNRSDTRYVTQQDIRYIIPGTALQFKGDDQVDAGSSAVYMSSGLQFGEFTRVELGLRYTSEHKDYEFSRLNYDGSISAFLDPIGATYGSGYYDEVTGQRALNGSVARQNENFWDWRLALTRDLFETAKIYGSIATGVKGGGVSARPFNATQALGGVFQHERLVSYELGIKGEFFDERLLLNTAVFYSDYKDVQLALRDCSDFGGGPCGVVANAGDGVISGVEVEGEIRLDEHWNVAFNGGWLSSEWRSLDPRVGTSVNRDDPVSSAPKNALTLSLVYETSTALGIFNAHAQYRYVAERFNGRAYQGTPYSLPEFSTASLLLSLVSSSHPLTLRLSAENIFDEKYFLARFDAISNFTGNAHSRLGEPRTVTAELIYQW